MNPLSWKSPVRPVIASGLSPTDSPLGSIFSILHGGLPSDDPFVSTKNPLAGALGRVEDKKQSGGDYEHYHSPANTGSSQQTEC